MCAIGIDGLYKFDLTIGNRSNFLKEDKFIKFILIENIGLSLPYWELQYDNVFPELLEYFNEKQPIQVQLGVSLKNLEPIDLVIKKPIIVPKSVDSQAVTLRGFNTMIDYLENENISKLDDSDSLTLAKTIANKYGLTFKTNMESTKDKMTYMQPCISDFKYLYTEWLHSDSGLQDDIIIPTITSQYTMTYNSLTKLINNADIQSLPTFVDASPEKNEIIVNANTGAESNTTISNMLGSYVKQRDIYYANTGMLEHIDVSNKTPIISESRTTSVDESISKSSGFYVQSETVHPTYYKQELLNTQKWFSIQSSKQWVCAPNTLVQNVYPGDLVMYMSKKSNGQVDDSRSGLFLVVKRVISIKNRKINTNFLLSRENLNYSR